MLMKIDNLEDYKKQYESFAKWREKYARNLHKQNCPFCKSEKVLIDNWGMFTPDRDFFYYCQECDYTWKLDESEIKDNENVYLL